MLELFPEDAATVRYGQKVEAMVQSLPGKNFTGRVAFIDPHVDPKTRTVGVRVVIPNEDGLLRVGDFAKATVDVPLSSLVDQPVGVYDPELADKWISPRHPHVVESSAGRCPICGVDLVPAAEFGFVAEQSAQGYALVVPRDAVLMAGENSVIYVESEPGRFEIRRVVLGPTCGDQIVVLSGVKQGEQVATRGNFLIDSQMQLAGNPSLIDPLKAESNRAESNRAESNTDEAMSEEMIAALAELSDEDRRQAEGQRICPVTKMPLGSMGTPPKVDVNGQTIFICCKGCEGRLLKDPQTYLANLTSGNGLDDEEERAITAALSKLTPADRAIVESQRICPVADYRLGSMGTPKKVDVNGTPVFICCDGCRTSLLEEPEKYLAKIASAGAAEDSSENSPMDLPPMGIPEMIEPHSGLPPMETPQAMLPTEVVR
jgi:YHS domain-containing protein